VAVALVRVEVDHHSLAHAAAVVALQVANGQGDISVDAKAATSRTRGVVVAAAQVDAHAALECDARAHDAAACGEQHRVEHKATQRPGREEENGHLENGGEVERRVQLGQVERRVHQQQLLARRHHRLKHVVHALDDLRRLQPREDAAVLARVERVEVLQPARRDVVVG
jgi:hypothetical protein